MFKDYYKILEINENSTENEIRVAFKRQAIRWHPDKNVGKDTTSIMQDINEAYLILKDKEAKEKYDIEYRLYKEYQTKNEPTITVFNSETYNKESQSQKDEEYTVKDEILFNWMQSAHKQAVDLAKLTLDELFGMTKAGLKAAGKEALFALIFLIVVSFLLLMISI